MDHMASLVQAQHAGIETRRAPSAVHHTRARINQRSHTALILPNVHIRINEWSPALFFAFHLQGRTKGERDLPSTASEGLGFMASATAMITPSLASSPTASRQPVATGAPHSVGLPSLPLPAQSSSSALYSQGREPWKSASYCRRIAGKVVAMATGEASAEVAIENPEILKTIQEAWEKLEDKYAVTSLSFFALIAIYVSAGMISAIDRLPLLPSIFELVGIGYTGWFAYRNIVFKPDSFNCEDKEHLQRCNWKQLKALFLP